MIDEIDMEQQFHSWLLKLILKGLTPMTSKYQFIKTFLIALLILQLRGTSYSEDNSSLSHPTKKQPVLSKVPFNPKAEKIDLFDGMKSSRLDAHLVPRNSLRGFFFIENKSKQPLSVQIPKSFVGIQVSKQFAPGVGFFNPNGQNGNNTGQGQTIGGAMGNPIGIEIPGNGFPVVPNFANGANNFFSIPAERIVKVPYQSVCLEYGKPEPRSRMKYKPVPPSEYTSDARLQNLLDRMGTTRIDPKVAQAAAWHLTDDLSWQYLSAKQVQHVGGIRSSYFRPAQLRVAQQLVKSVQLQTRQKVKQDQKRTKSSTEKSK